MKQSSLITKTLREAPKDETSASAALLLRAGFISKEMAGVYDYLPLGWMTLQRILQVIREEMNLLGGVELQLSALQDKQLWETTNRWGDDVVDNWFKTELKDGREVGLGFTHEEPITRLMKQYIQSYKDLPKYPFQIQLKFRNELRAKSGMLRVREFLMKDMYSFSRNEESHNIFYEKASAAYQRIFTRLGIGESTYKTFASGGTFSKYSHEFQTLCSAGEDIIYVSKEKGIAVNKEVYTDEVLQELGLSKEELAEEKAIEVGNIFTLGSRFSEPLELFFTDEDGERKPVFMGCYGIGPGRILGTIAELCHDDAGLVWPKEVAPFAVHLLNIGREESSQQAAEAIYSTLQENGVTVLFDDRDARAGEKFADSDLIGMPLRVLVSDKHTPNQQVEIKNRKTGEVSMVPFSEVTKFCAS